MQGDYPRVLYHLAIKRPRNVFGRVIEGADPVHDGDMLNPNYPISVGASTIQDLRGKHAGHNHIIPMLHYKTMMVAVYLPDGQIDEEASKAEEQRLALEGWVRHPSQLKEEYDED